MGVSVYIARDEHNKEKGFEYPYERQAALQIAKSLWRRYSKSSTHYALIANIDVPPIDLVLLTNNGMGIIDLKDYNSPISGTEDSPWTLTDDSSKQLTSGSHLNPFQQVKTYRRRVFGRLRGFSAEHSKQIPVWLSREQFYIQAALVFSGQKFDTSQLRISPSASRPWFRLLWIDDVIDWAYSLKFGKAHRLDLTQIDFIARTFFGAKPWDEIAGHLQSRAPYGYLWAEIDGALTWPIALDQDEMVIGRLPENNITLDSVSFPLVSRSHAKIRQSAEVVLISDLNSKHGTWVNKKRLQPNEELRLETGDRIVLGICDEDGKPGKGACTLVYRASGRYVGITASRELS